MAKYLLFLFKMFSSTIITRVIKSRRMRWPESVECEVERKCAYRSLLEKLVGKRTPERSGRRLEDSNE
jgi:hypothetical protein